MADKLIPPTEEYIIALKDHLVSTYSGEDSRVREIREHRQLQKKVQLEDKFRVSNIEYRDPAISEEIFAVTNALAAEPPKLTVVPTKSNRGEKGESNATKREHFTMELLRIIGQHPSGHTFQKWADACAGDGGGWSKVVWKKDMWDHVYSVSVSDFNDDVEKDDDGNPVIRKTAAKKQKDAREDAKQEAGPPLEWLPVDVTSVYPLWYGSKLGEIIELQNRPVFEAFMQFRIRRNKEGNIVRLGTDVPSEALGLGVNQEGLPSSIEFIEHWDGKFVTYVVKSVNLKGEPTSAKVKQIEHGYPRVPYFFAPGITMNWWRNIKVGWSISHTKKWLVEYVSYLRTIMEQYAARDILPPLSREFAVESQQFFGKDGEPAPSEDYEPAEIINNFPAGSQLRPITLPTASANITTELALTQQQMDTMSAPRAPAVLQGLEGAGFATNLAIELGNKRYTPFVVSLQQGLADITRFIWAVIKSKVKEDIWLHDETTDPKTKKARGWIALGPKDLGTGVVVNWRLPVDQASTEVIRSRYWHERLQAGTAHFDQAVEAMGDNPDEVRIGKVIDRIRESEWYVELQEQALREEVVDGGLLDQAMEMQQVAETGMLPGGMPPGGAPPGGEGIPPELMAALAGGPPPGGAPPAGPPMAPAGGGLPPGGQVPDVGALSQAAGGGAVTRPKLGLGPPNGSVRGIGPGAVMPTRSATVGKL